MYIVYHMCISIHKQITHTDVDLFIFCHVSCYANGKCHWLPPGVGPRVNQKDCKMGGAFDNFPQEWVNKKKSSGSTASQWKIPLTS